MIKVTYPVTGVVTQGFGENPQNYSQFGIPGHNGVDFGIPTGTPIKAAYDGIVEKVGFENGGYGNYIKLKHSADGKQFYTLYAHLSNPTAYTGNTVKQGATIGLSGNTGNSTGPHLHFELIIPGEGVSGYKDRVDPMKYLTTSPSTGTTPDEPTNVEDGYAIVNATLGLNIRLEPSMLGKILTTAAYGTKFKESKEPIVDAVWQPLIVYASKEYLDT